ncbi:MAG TPA: sugar nucleotide-binding protein [Burkholderiales bacterium]|nr:sugar nucleotide-binding protein [Burkholderiales bacterium]
MSQRFIIIGASGFIGSHLYRRLGPESAIATYHGNPLPGGLQFDAARMRLSNILEHHRGITHGFIFHGITSFEACAKDPAGTWKINVASVRTVIDDLAAYGITPIFTSSDAVFDGRQGGRTEQDPATPITTYGRQKVEIEEYLSARYSDAITVRISKILGTHSGVNDMLGDWIRQLEAGAEIRCAYDHIFSPADIEDIVSALISLADRKLHGLFHLCGPEPISRLDLLNMLVGEFRKYRDTASKIAACSLQDFASLEPRPLNTSMSSQKLRAALGMRFKTPREICRQRIASHFAAISAARN